MSGLRALHALVRLFDRLFKLTCTIFGFLRPLILLLILFVNGIGRGKSNQSKPCGFLGFLAILLGLALLLDLLGGLSCTLGLSLGLHGLLIRRVQLLFICLSVSKSLHALLGGGCIFLKQKCFCLCLRFLLIPRGAILGICHVANIALGLLFGDLHLLFQLGGSLGVSLLGVFGLHKRQHLCLLLCDGLLLHSTLVMRLSGGDRGTQLLHLRRRRFPILRLSLLCRSQRTGKGEHGSLRLLMRLGTATHGISLRSCLIGGASCILGSCLFKDRLLIRLVQSGSFCLSFGQKHSLGLRALCGALGNTRLRLGIGNVLFKALQGASHLSLCLFLCALFLLCRGGDLLLQALHRICIILFGGGGSQREHFGSFTARHRLRTFGCFLRGTQGVQLILRISGILPERFAAAACLIHRICGCTLICQAQSLGIRLFGGAHSTVITAFRICDRGIHSAAFALRKRGLAAYLLLCPHSGGKGEHGGLRLFSLCSTGALLLAILHDRIRRAPCADRLGIFAKCLTVRLMKRTRILLRGAHLLKPCNGGRGRLLGKTCLRLGARKSLLPKLDILLISLFRSCGGSSFLYAGDNALLLQLLGGLGVILIRRHSSHKRQHFRLACLGERGRSLGSLLGGAKRIQPLLRLVCLCAPSLCILGGILGGSTARSELSQMACLSLCRSVCTHGLLIIPLSTRELLAEGTVRFCIRARILRIQRRIRAEGRKTVCIRRGLHTSRHGAIQLCKGGSSGIDSAGKNLRRQDPAQGLNASVRARKPRDLTVIFLNILRAKLHASACDPLVGIAIQQAKQCDLITDHVQAALGGIRPARLQGHILCVIRSAHHLVALRFDHRHAIFIIRKALNLIFQKGFIRYGAQIIILSRNERGVVLRAADGDTLSRKSGLIFGQQALLACRKRRGARRKRGRGLHRGDRSLLFRGGLCLHHISDC